MLHARHAVIGAGLLGATPAAFAATAFAGPTVAGIPVEFILFAITLTGVALFHHRTMPIAVTGAAVIALYKIAFSPFRTGAGVGGFFVHLGHEWVGARRSRPPWPRRHTTRTRLRSAGRSSCCATHA